MHVFTFNIKVFSVIAKIPYLMNVVTSNFSFTYLPLTEKFPLFQSGKTDKPLITFSSLLQQVQYYSSILKVFEMQNTCNMHSEDAVRRRTNLPECYRLFYGSTWNWTITLSMNIKIWF